jgi:hypothetical protein
MPIEQIDVGSWEQRRELVQALTEPVQAASMASESLRRLNHLLGRVGAACEVYDLVGQLAYCLARMPQALEGLDIWLRRELEAGRLCHDSGGSVSDAVLPASAELTQVSLLVTQAGEVLRCTQRRLSPLYGPVVDEERGCG